MEWFICNRCGAAFNEENAATESFRHTEVTPHFTENFLACPGCLSTDYEDAAFCYRCGEPKRYSDLRGGYYCDSCVREISSKPLESLYIRENYDDYADWLHERRAKHNADETDPKDI